MRQHGVIASIQPQFVPSDAGWLASKLPPQLLGFAYPWKSLLEAGRLTFCADRTPHPYTVTYLLRCSLLFSISQAYRLHFVVRDSVRVDECFVALVFLLRDADTHSAYLLRQRHWVGARVAVCHSRYCIKTAKPMLKLFRPSGSPII